MKEIIEIINYTTNDRWLRFSIDKTQNLFYKKSSKSRCRCVICHKLHIPVFNIYGKNGSQYFCPKCWIKMLKELLFKSKHIKEYLIEEQI